MDVYRRPKRRTLAITAAVLAGGLFVLPQTWRARAADDPTLTALLRSRIKYVFVIYQENRSFDSYFGTFPGADGLFSHGPALPAGFEQPILNTDGSSVMIRPFRIGPAQFAADTDDVDHSHTAIVAKMDIVDGRPRMDRFALTEERRFAPAGNPSLQAKQFGELTMAYTDCDTVPFLWRYARRFTLFDAIHQLMTGPSTPGNLSIIAAQTGITQRLLHPDEAAGGANGDSGAGVPVLDDEDPFWGSPSDPTTARRMPANPNDFPGYGTQRNLTFASLPLTLGGNELAAVVRGDTDPTTDLRDVGNDVSAIGRGTAPTPWGWYEEGYDREPANPDDGPETADGTHAAYVTHHNGPQYFGYVANNPAMRAHLHGLDDFRHAVERRTLPAGGVFYLKGGYRNLLGLKPADPDAKVQTRFVGDDDHPAYSDSQISEAMVADLVNRIARSPYWKQSAIVLTWDDSEGNYDHAPPRIRQGIPGEEPDSDGPRVPLIVISPFAKAQTIVHDVGDHGSVVKFVDSVFGLPPLATLPDEKRAADIGRSLFGGDGDFGPVDADQRITDLSSAFDRDRLRGTKPPLPARLAIVPDVLLATLPQRSGYGCRSIGITPVDIQMHIANFIPADFNPRPKTDPSVP